MRYLFNTAVIPGPGVYRYELIDVPAARIWLAAGPWESRIGYGNARDYIQQTLGVRCELSRVYSFLEPGEEALVVRLSYRLQDPAKKRGGFNATAEDWELGLLLCQVGL